MGGCMKILGMGLLFVLMKLSLFAGTRDAQWKRVEEAIRQGLPQTAITNLEPILSGALKEKAYAEAVRALGEKIVLEASIQGNKPEEKITRLSAEISKAPKAMVPVLDALLAHWYWQYFQQNRWRFMQRTATAEVPGQDFTAWDLPRLFHEIDQQFQNALAAEATLKATPIAAWDGLLVKGTLPDSYRPTLYDFLAHEALNFYTSGEQAGAKPQDNFEISAAMPIFDSADVFLAWNPVPAGSEAESGPGLRAVRLYQALLKFHQNDPLPRPALAAVDLERLSWGWNTAFGEDKKSRYQAALEAFVTKYRDCEVAALALEHEARLLQEQEDLVGARKLAQRGLGLFPNSAGGKLCRNLVTEIEAKSVVVSTERVWTCFAGSGVGLPTNPDSPGAAQPQQCAAIQVRYRNLDAVFFRAIPYDWAVFLQSQHNRPETLNDAERRELLNHKPALEWSERLPATTDFKERTQVLTAPKSLQPGFYFIVASPKAGFGEKDNMVSLAPVWISDLALITRTRAGQVEGFVLAAESGEPIAGADVFIWHLDRTGNRVADPELKTDENGWFWFKPAANRGFLFRARYHGREIASVGDLWNYQYRNELADQPRAQTVFFTDRGIYRPGQIIQYKGICCWVDQQKDDYHVLQGESLTVVFRDQNGKEIARQKVQSNDYGSFTGSFAAPRSGLMGQMSLQVDGRAQGMAWIRVEEYKRPKFQVTLESPKIAPRLNAEVSLAGHAMTYAGAAVDGAPVRYRVVREARMPWWWGWYGRAWRAAPEQEIAHGTVTTELDGTFQIAFKARPDPSIPETDDPSFVYRINADVTDNAGETRSAEQSIRVGYTALEASLSAADWQTPAAPVDISVTTRTLDGDPQVAEGRVLIYELQAPAKPEPAPLSGPAMGRALVSADDASTDLSDPNHWPLGKVVSETGFTTDTNGLAKLPFHLAVGA